MISSVGSGSNTIIPGYQNHAPMPLQKKHPEGPAVEEVYHNWALKATYSLPEQLRNKNHNQIENPLIPKKSPSTKTEKKEGEIYNA